MTPWGISPWGISPWGGGGEAAAAGEEAGEEAIVIPTYPARVDHAAAARARVLQQFRSNPAGA